MRKIQIKGKVAACFGVAIGLLMASSWTSCKNTKQNDETDTIAAQKPLGPDFNADSAYSFCAAQCAFGARVMNSKAHDLCEQWIIDKFRSFGCIVSTQKTTVNGYDGTPLRCTNIIARFRPEASRRILLCAHWDSRPWADNDPDSTQWRKPVMGANDGASGVAVMLEIARLLKADSTLRIGIDFVCFDAEDYGTPQWSSLPADESSWALGAQYWAKNIPSGYKAAYGIVLDMVGGQGATFYQEGYSKQYAGSIVDKFWNAAHAIGYSSYFPIADGGFITDDHDPVNKYAQIPTIDIVPYYPNCAESAFGPTWHTVSDDMAHIDRNTLKAVGQTLLHVLFSE